MSKPPKQKPGKSVQNVRTPPELLDAVKRRLKIAEFDIDLAADQHNRAAEDFYSESTDALIHPWNMGTGWNWCNPPYAKIGPWVEKAIAEAQKGAQTVMLVPASVGSNWWANASANAYACFLSPRVTFVGHTSPYPKDLAILLFTPWGFCGNEIWYWNPKYT